MTKNLMTVSILQVIWQKMRLQSIILTAVGNFFKNVKLCEASGKRGNDVLESETWQVDTF